MAEPNKQIAIDNEMEDFGRSTNLAQKSLSIPEIRPT
jgi:hypothetical protein